jgi:hypothetical protein
MRFAMREPASGVISRLEGLASGGAMRVTKSGARGVRLEGAERGRKGRLGVAAEFFSVAPSVLMVDVKKDGGDTMEYRSFCSDELRLALEDIVWAAAASVGEPTCRRHLTLHPWPLVTASPIFSARSSLIAKPGGHLWLTGTLPRWRFSGVAGPPPASFSN